MTFPLLTTKFYIPTIRPDQVSRAALIGRLNAGLDHKLTLISAPAGFGKTTLVSEWVNTLQTKGASQKQIASKIAWISLDENDNDLARFLAYFVTALLQIQGIDADVGEGVLEMLQGPQTPPVKDILTVLINKIATLRARLIVVMDDYHLIESAHINAALAFLIEYLPPQIHLVIVTRDDPHLPLARFRAKGEMIELRASDLRFSPDEITIFLQQKLGIQLSPNEIAGLEAHTEGWITGLHLVAVSIQGQENIRRAIQDISGSHRFVLDYLLEEVLNQQPDDIQEFLLQTAILNRLTGSLCDSLTGLNNGQETLEYLEHANLFIIPLDQERSWYRYHHLFADLLQLRLHRTYLEKEPDLHLRASEWYEQNGFIDDAIDHSLNSEDYDRTVQLIVEHIDDISKRSQYFRLWFWLKQLPEEFIYSAPDLCILNAWYLFTQGKLDYAEKNLRIAEKFLTSAAASMDDSTKHHEISGRVAAIRALVHSYRGDIPGILKNAQKALDVLPQQDLVWRSAVAFALGDAYTMAGDLNSAYKARIEALNVSKIGGNIYMILISGMKLAVTERMLGQLQLVIDICQEQFYIANQRGVTQMAAVGWLLAIWAEVLAEMNQMDEALAKGKKGAEIAAQGDDIAMIGWSHVCFGRILFSQGDIDGAENIFCQLEEISLDRHMPAFNTVQISAWQARILLARQKLDRAKQWVQARDLKIDGKINQLNEVEYLAFARVLLAQGQLNEAIGLLHRLHDAVKAAGRISRNIEILILLALASNARGDTEQAMDNLEQALTHAEACGFVRIFVDEGPKMARLLYEAANRKIAPAYAQRILAAFPTLEPVQSLEAKSIQDGSPEFIEQLSDRELEVLCLIADGLSRQEISEKLVLSLNTVKTHVRNIYGKLGVNNQMQAVGKARGLGLLEEN